MPIELGTKTTYMRVVHIIDEDGNEVNFANTDLNVDFLSLTLPEHLTTNSKKRSMMSLEKNWTIGDYRY